MKNASIFIFLFAFLLLPSINAQSGIPIAFQSDSSLAVRIYFDTPEIRQLCEDSKFEPLIEAMGQHGDYLVKSKDIIMLNLHGARYEMISGYIPRNRATISSTEVDSIYHTYNEMVTQLFARAASYPSIARVESIGVTQQEHRIMYAFKISDNVAANEDEPVVYFDGAHHACEVIGMEICLALIDTLLTNYGVIPNITNIINSNEIWIVPLVNPDGHSAVMNDISHYYRKNGRDLNGNGILYEYSCNTWWDCSTEGIDLNRNYDWYWNSGGLPDPWSYYYRGASAGSEFENQAITGLLTRVRPQLAISYHSYGELVYYPWAMGVEYAGDNDAIVDVAENIGSLIMKENGSFPYDVYINDGQSGMNINWLYGRLGTFSYTIETVAYPDFIIPAARYHNVVSQNLKGCFALLQRAQGTQLTGIVTSAETGQPLHAEIRILEVYSNRVNPRMTDASSGRYRWLLLPGEYTIQVIADSFPSFTYSNIVVGSNGPTTFNICLHSFLSGDANNDSIVSGADVTYLVRYFKGFGPPPVPYLAGDANGSCAVGGSDVTALVYYFRGGTTPRYGDCQ
jgi:carboxypeptidase T